MPRVEVTVLGHHLPDAALILGRASETELLVAVVETALEQEPARRSAETYAVLMLMAVLPWAPETIALQIAFRERGRPGRFRGKGLLDPSATRLTQGSVLLRSVAACAPEGARPPLLCALAWLHWAAGRRAIAMAYLSESERLNPAYALTQELSSIVAARMPDWCSKRVTCND